jgi:hypothetical protein
MGRDEDTGQDGCSTDLKLTPNAPVLENGSLRAWARTHPAPVQPPCKRSRGPLALQDVVAMTVTHSFVRHDACRCREAPHSIRVSGCVCLEKGREREIGGIEMLAPYPYPQADQSHCTSPTSLEIIAVAVAGSGSGDWKWEHPCFFANCGAQSESFVLSVEGSRRERRSGCRCHPNTSARTAQQPSSTQEQHLVVWPNGISSACSSPIGAATHAGSLAPWPSRVDVSGPVNARHKISLQQSRVWSLIKAPHPP